MRIVVAGFILLAGLMMRAAPAQEKPPPPISVFSVDTGRPVHHFALCDFDGDGLIDAFFVTKTRPASAIVVRRLGPKQGFGPPLGCEIPEDCGGLILRGGPGGTVLLSLAGGGAVEKRMADFKPVVGQAPAEGDPPALYGFAPDLDGDQVGDPIAPTPDGYRIALSKSGRSIAVRPPVARERAAGVRGLLTERARFPLASLERLGPGAAPRPCFFARNALYSLRGSLETGFGPETDKLLELPPSSQEATLERTEARLVDVEGDGTPELLVVRTRTQVAALAQVRTELLFYRLGAAGPPRPLQAILLPGILSSGPDVTDVDKDGRLDLFLSVFGEDLSQQLTRRITGRVRIEYLLYRGLAAGGPFARSPDFSETDSVPEASFSEWGLRHRLMLDADWSGDGTPDLVQMTSAAGRTRIEIRPGTSRDGKLGFAKDAVSSADSPATVKDHRLWRLSASEPAVICRTGTGAVIFTASP